MAKTKLINLLPQEEFEASIVGRLLKWATGTFRIIVIITEMVVMGAFLSRFWLDAQNSDLTDSISIKAAQIQSQSEFENTFRQIQKKLNIIKTISGATKGSDRISLIASKVPQEIVISGISIDDGSAQIKGASISEFGIAQFMTNLQTEKTFKNVELASLSSEEDSSGQSTGQIKFAINIDF